MTKKEENTMDNLNEVKIMLTGAVLGGSITAYCR